MSIYNYNYDPICANYQCPETIGIGSTVEPYNTNWLNVQTKAFGPFLREGLKVLDYGCGIGRFANHLSRFVRNFQYLGLDLDNEHGHRCLKHANKYLGHDPRVSFDFIPALDTYIHDYIVVLFGSVFTHTNIEFTRDVLRKFIEYNYTIIFDAIIESEYKLLEHNHTDNTLQQYRDIVKDLPVTLHILPHTFTTEKDRTHSFFRIEQNNNVTTR